MILVPGKFVYLATPATGSRTTVRVLEEQCGGVQLNTTHHARGRNIEALECLVRREPVYSLIRDPADYLLIRYQQYQKSRQAKGITFIDYVGSRPPLFKEFGPRLAPYWDHVDKFFLFKDGLEAFFTAVGFPDVDIPVIGRTELGRPRLKVEDLTPEEVKTIREKFPEDVELYEELTSKKR